MCDTCFSAKNAAGKPLLSGRKRFSRNAVHKAGLQRTNNSPMMDADFTGSRVRVAGPLDACCDDH